MLPDSNVNEPTSHGYVLFEIRPKTFLSNQTVASNSASIFFDLNSPVQTNTVFNTLVYSLPTTINEVTDDDCLRIFPTIVDDKIFVLNNCNQRIKEFSIYNGLGQLMKKEEHHSGNSDNYIDVTKLPNGFYILMMKDVFSNISCKKFIKN